MKLNKEDINIDKDITYFLNPDYIYIPIDNKNYLVKQNSKVYKNMLVTKNLSSSISGIAIGMSKYNVMNKLQNVIVVQNDFREYTKLDKYKIKLTIPNLIKNITNKGILDKIKSNKLFNNIVLNVINDEPYIYNKIYLLKENTLELIELLNKLSTIYKSSNVYVVIKSNTIEIVSNLLNILGSFPNMKLILVDDEYLLEVEDFLLKKLNIKGSILYLDMEDLTEINDTLKGSSSSTKLITVSGDVISSKVLRVKKYTLLKDILDKYIEIYDNDYMVIVNGLMKGFIVSDVDKFIITDNIKYINVMKRKIYKESKCIKCGKCISVCPMHIDMLNKINMDKCIDCGLCSYICPAHINLRSNNGVSKE